MGWLSLGTHGICRPTTPHAACFRHTVAVLALLAAWPAAAQQQAATPSASLALLIANAGYASLAPLPACSASAKLLAERLRRQGFVVVERLDSSAGGIDSALAELSRRIAEQPAAPVLIYVCGRAVAFNGRPFLLPVTARLQRPSDVLTQGVLAKVMIDLLARQGTGPALAVFDLAAHDDAQLGELEGLVQSPAPDGLAAVAGGASGQPGEATALAAVLTASLAAAPLRVAALATALATDVPGTAVRAPARDGMLLAPPVPSLAPISAVTTPSPATVPTASIAAAPAAAAPAPAAKPSLPPLPDEAQMSLAERQQVQAALRRLGYYAGQDDGIFGPDTRAAIRRFQHEIGAEMTGRLLSLQATRLVRRQP